MKLHLDIETFSDTSGQGQDSGTLVSALAPLASPVFTTTVQSKGYGNSTAATLAAGAAAGSSPTIACTTSHKCTATSGTITLTVGTSPTTGALLTITDGVTKTNLHDCWAHIVLTASPYTETSGYSFSYTTTVDTLNVGVALTASTSYTITYGCLGY